MEGVGEVEFAVAFGGADADLNGPAGLIDEIASPQIPCLASDEGNITGMTDTHSTAVSWIEPSVFRDPE